MPSASIQTVVLAPLVRETEPKWQPRTRPRRFPYGTTLVALLFVTAMGGQAGTGADVFQPAPMQIGPAQVSPADPDAEPPTVVNRTSLRPLHRPF